MNKPIAAILLSTWNGAEYLRPQVDSILNQTIRNFLLIVRDDGSVDGTRAMLDEYVDRDARIIVHHGRNLGAAGSFLDLLRLGRGTAAAYFYADQDDVWQADKLALMTESLRRFDPCKPALYYTAVRLVDANARPLQRQLPFLPPPSFGQAIVQGIAQGCVMALNDSLLNLLAGRLPDPSKLVMHDMWTMMAAAAFGVVAGDPIATVSYRQHGRNVFGGQTGLNLFKTRVRRVLRGEQAGRLAAQAQEFGRMFSDILAAEHRYTLDDFLRAATGPLDVRLSAALSRRYGRFGAVDDLLLRTLLVSGFHRTRNTA